MSSFTDLLNTPTKDIEEPLNLPEGTYIWQVSKVHSETTNANGEWFILTIPIVPVAVYEEADDIDPAELEAFGDLRAGVNSIRFMAPTASDADNERKRTQNNIRRFLVDTLQLEDTGDETLKELLSRMVGSQFIAQAVHRPDIERDRVYIDVKHYMPLI